MAGIRRRLEAIPLDLSSMTRDQGVAVEEVAGWLLQALDAIPDEEKAKGCVPSFPPIPRIDDKRYSQIAFIDGERGTGKSSVLLSLMKLMTQEPSEEGVKSAEGRFQCKNMKELYKRRESFVWLEPLDMEPLCPGTNLFAAILARLEILISRSQQHRSSLAMCLQQAEGTKDPLITLRQLQTDVAIAWERLEGGQYQGDQEQRALSILRAEKAAVEIPRRLGELLEEITFYFCHCREYKKLFILPVDDFDLAPAHTLSLLNLIRMITNSRLFFVAAGNVKIAEAAIFVRSEGFFRGIAGGEFMYPKYVKGVIKDMAKNNLRKLLPPGARVKLRPVKLDELFDFGKKEYDFSIKSIIKDTAIPYYKKFISSGDDSFSGLFCLEKLFYSKIYNFSWLIGTAREIVDFNFSLKKVFISFNEEKYSNKEDVVMEIAFIFIKKFELTYRGPIEFGFENLENFSRDCIWGRFWFGSYFSIDIINGEKLDNGNFFNLNSDRRQRFIFKGMNFHIRLFVPEGLSQSEVANATIAKYDYMLSSFVMFLHDLIYYLIIIDRPSPLSNYMMYQCDQSRQNDCSVCIEWEESRFRQQWRSPRWVTFREYDLFFHCLKKRVENSPVQQMGLVWICSIFDVVFSRDELYGYDLELNKWFDALFKMIAMDKYQSDVLSDVVFSIFISILPESAHALYGVDDVRRCLLSSMDKVDYLKKRENLLNNVLNYRLDNMNKILSCIRELKCEDERDFDKLRIVDSFDKVKGSLFPVNESLFAIDCEEKIVKIIHPDHLKKLSEVIYYCTSVSYVLLLRLILEGKIFLSLDNSDLFMYNSHPDDHEVGERINIVYGVYGYFHQEGQMASNVLCGFNIFNEKAISKVWSFISARNNFYEIPLEEDVGRLIEAIVKFSQTDFRGCGEGYKCDLYFKIICLNIVKKSLHQDLSFNELFEGALVPKSLEVPKQ